MNNLNYHHLYYFWTVVKEGTISAACKKLGLAQPTISAQLHSLEEALGEQLFNRVGRNLVLTESGRVVYRYAEDIFLLGRELVDTLQGRPTGRPIRLKAGVADVLPKLVAYRLLEPALHLKEPIQLVCYEGKSSDLLARLSVHELDVVLSDSPIGQEVKVKGYNHLLGECGVTVFGTAKEAEGISDFPHSLDGAPFLLPTENTSLRRSLNQWFEKNDIHPKVIGEFEDSALLKVFGQRGAGLFAAPSVIEEEIVEQYGVKPLGQLEEVRESFYAISVERKIKHPAVASITQLAREDFFS
jgi:LysR family transcriptional regulator, transcriptional activator of nhaA